MAKKLDYYIRDIQTNAIVKDSEVSDPSQLLGITGAAINNALNRSSMLLNNNRYLIHRDADVLRNAPIVMYAAQCRYEATLIRVSTTSMDIVYQTKEPTAIGGLEVYPNFPVNHLSQLAGCSLARVMIKTPITIVMSGFKLIVKCVEPKSIDHVTVDLVKGSLSFYTLEGDDTDTRLTMEEMLVHLANVSGIGPFVYTPSIFEIYRILSKLSRGKTATVFGCTFTKHPHK